MRSRLSYSQKAIWILLKHEKMKQSSLNLVNVLIQFYEVVI
jgi:hypothetical protein